MDITIVTFVIFLTISAKQIRDNNLLRSRQIPIKSVAVRYLPTAVTFDYMHSYFITSQNKSKKRHTSNVHASTYHRLRDNAHRWDERSWCGAGSADYTGIIGLLSVKATDRSAAAQGMKTENFE